MNLIKGLERVNKSCTKLNKVALTEKRRGFFKVLTYFLVSSKVKIDLVSFLW